MNKIIRAKARRFLTALALLVGPALTGEASAQEIMLERVGAVRMAAPGELERNDEWLQKAFRNQARIEDSQAIRVSSAPVPDEGAPQR